MGKSTESLSELRHELFERIARWPEADECERPPMPGEYERPPFSSASFPDEGHPLRPVPHESDYRIQSPSWFEERYPAIAALHEEEYRDRRIKSLHDLMEISVRYGFVSALINAGCSTRIDAIRFLRGMPDGRNGEEGVSPQTAGTHYNNPCGMSAKQVEWLCASTGFSLDQLRSMYWLEFDSMLAEADANEAWSIIRSLRYESRKRVMDAIKGFAC